jgi:hypothetical protein
MKPTSESAMSSARERHEHIRSGSYRLAILDVEN